MLTLCGVPQPQVTCCRQLRRIQRQCAAEELRLLAGADQNGSPNTGLEAAAGLDSDDSEGQLGGGWGPKALPRLGGYGGGATSTAMGGSGAMLGAGKLAAGAAALGLQLLPSEDSGGSSSGGAAGEPGPAGGGGRSRLSVSSAAGLDAAGEGQGTFGGASLIPAHRAPGGSSSGGSRRPGSARRATGSGNALLRRAGGSGGAGEAAAADVLLLDGTRQRASWHDADNDF